MDESLILRPGSCFGHLSKDISPWFWLSYFFNSVQTSTATHWRSSPKHGIAQICQNTGAVPGNWRNSDRCPTTVDVAHILPCVVTVRRRYRIVRKTQKESHWLHWEGFDVQYALLRDISFLFRKRLDQHVVSELDVFVNALCESFQLLFPSHSVAISHSSASAYLLPWPTKNSWFFLCCWSGCVFLLAFDVRAAIALKAESTPSLSWWRGLFNSVCNVCRVVKTTVTTTKLYWAIKISSSKASCKPFLLVFSKMVKRSAGGLIPTAIRPCNRFPWASARCRSYVRKLKRKARTVVFVWAEVKEGWKTLCIEINYSERIGVECREASSTLAESFRVTILIGWRSSKGFSLSNLISCRELLAKPGSLQQCV